MVRSYGINEDLDRQLLASRLLVACREEAGTLAGEVFSEIDSPAGAARLITRFPYRLTPRAATQLALRATGGGLRSILAMMSAGRLVLIQRRAERPIAASTVRRRRQAVPVAEPRAEAATATSWIRFRVVHHVTGEPFEGVRLTVRAPSGREMPVRTNSSGYASLEDIDAGVCDVGCLLPGARLERTVAFVGMDAPLAPIESPGTGTLLHEVATAEWIAHVDEHHVQTGETLKSIAESHAYTWQELAEFNWGTSDPDRINQHLHNDVGCTERTRDGFNYRFTTEDEPGLIYIPRPWWQSGLATEQTHVIRVRLSAGFRLILENDDKLRIPEAEYEATLSDGSVLTGRLGRSGVARIKDPPPGPVDVCYLDLNDVEAKSLAATVRKALDDRQPLEIHRLFRYPTETVQRTFEAYDRYFNDYHGRGLRYDLEQEFFGDEEAELIFFGYMHHAEMPWNNAASAEPGPALEEPAHV